MIEKTVVNSLVIPSGTICDGAKPSCAAKIASAVDADGDSGAGKGSSGRVWSPP